MIKLSKFCSESLHLDTDRCCFVQNMWKLSERKSVKSWVVYMTKKNRLPLKLSLLRIMLKVCHGQPPTFGSQRPKFHPNWFTFGGVIDGRVKAVLWALWVNPILAQSDTSLWANNDNKQNNSIQKFQTPNTFNKFTKGTTAPCAHSISRHVELPPARFPIAQAHWSYKTPYTNTLNLSVILSYVSYSNSWFLACTLLNLVSYNCNVTFKSQLTILPCFLQLILNCYLQLQNVVQVLLLHKIC